MSNLFHKILGFAANAAGAFRRSKRDQAIAPGEIPVRIGTRSIIVKALVIKDYELLIDTIVQFVSKLQAQGKQREADAIDRIDIADLAKGDLARQFQTLGPVALDLVGEIVQALYGIEPDYLRSHCTLKQALDLGIAILEANEVPEIRKNLARTRLLLVGENQTTK